MSRAPFAVAAVLAGLLVGAPAAAAATAPCPRDSRCLTVRVPLDRSGAVPGTVALRHAVVQGRDADAAPLVLLTGGPGQAGVSFTRDWGLLLGLTGVRRTFVTVDVRGSGDSGLLRCPAFERAIARTPQAGAGSCGRDLGPRRSFYRSSDAAEDLEALRVRLGVPKLALLAVSYGTRIAVEYARRYPARTDRVILDSAVDDAADAFVGETFAAIPRVIRALCRRSCPGGGRQPVADLARLARRLRARSVDVTVRGSTVRVDEDLLLSTLIASDLIPELMRPFPAAVRDALAGRPGALAQLAVTAEELNAIGAIREFSPALYAATLCEEAPLAWDRAAAPELRRQQALAALASRPEAAFAPFSRDAGVAAGLLPLCEDWPAPARPAPADPPAATPVPILILAGDLDLRTPLEGARRLATRLGNAVVVRAPDVGHSAFGASLSGCATRSVAAFLRGRLPACAR
ncbi:alpha/beta hydrolase [Svornostia abyssi]|uniref:Alpha/beta hydrolase n=1 Tax=Svornostia abyssi TaxID=2898438 RepID=A0ABY5PC83_9ACTN|nr:alpha/beta hydrolase [Parviterribacteraceae bacterium J379]